MLQAFPNAVGTLPGDAPPLHPAAVWIDLFEPTDAEARLVAELTGLHVPTLAELNEIESSSRLRRRGEALYLSSPAVMRDARGPRVTPVGYVLTRDRLLTVRFAALPAFEAFGRDCAAADAQRRGSADLFLGLLEAIVDRIADVLERESDELDTASRSVFGADADTRKPARVDRELRATLRRIGLVGDLLSRLRDTLLGIGRIVPFVETNAAAWLAPEHHPRFASLRADIVSLSDYDAQLSGKVQFLLDATLGFIGIQQNNIIKVLTIVSIVGVPPTFIASMYGMNFKNIPELQWNWGYQYALALMLVSAVAPLVWFRIRGWL